MTTSDQTPAAGSSAHAEMHLAARGISAGLVWFLRPRGDAPENQRTTHGDHSVPPPTRRCTALALVLETCEDGSSAHAEMHRTHEGGRPSVDGFLRPRGDAPGIAADLTRSIAVPPPTRRCTARLDTTPRCAAGSSAHAEMHRGSRGSPGLRARFLRPRGDAPDHRAGSGAIPAVPPPTRRCTRVGPPRD